MTSISLDPSLDSRFLVTAELGKTANGQIWRVQPRAGGDAKILEIRRANASQQGLLSAQRLLELDHPSLARLEEMAACESGVYWLREDLGDVTLETVMADGEPLDISTAFEILDQILEALQALHVTQTWVRNLSPAALYLRRGSSGPRVVLADLGISHGLSGDSILNATSAFIGGLRFASPEQFEDESRVSASSDLYTLGLIAFELLTGQFPIAGETPSSLIAGHLFRPPLTFEQADPRGRVPELARAWVLARLAKNPQERGDLIGVKRALSGLRASVDEADFTKIEALLEPVKPRAGAAFQAVEEALEGGDLATARRLVEVLRGESTGPEVIELARRVAAVEGFTHAADVHRLVSEAQRRLASGAPSSAVGHLEEARELVPDDAEVERLLIVAKRTAVRSAQGRPDGPTAMLGQVQELIDREGEAQALRAQEKQQTRGVLTADLLEQARKSAEIEDFESARATLQRILSMTSDHPEALALMASIDAIQRIKTSEVEQRDTLERTAGDIRRLLEGGEEEQAKQSLDAATQRFGAAEILDTVRFDVTRARLDSEVSRTVQLTPEQLQAAIAAETASPEPSHSESPPPGPSPPGPPPSDSATPMATRAHSTLDVQAGATQMISPDLLEEVARKSGPMASDELPSTVTLSSEKIDQARQRALAEVAKADVRVPGGGSVTLPMETIEAAKRRAMELRAKELGSATPPPAIRTPGPGSVTLPMQAVEEAKRRAFDQQAAQAPRPASTVPVGSSPPPVPISPPSWPSASTSASGPASTSASGSASGGASSADAPVFEPASVPVPSVATQQPPTQQPPSQQPPARQHQTPQPSDSQAKPPATGQPPAAVPGPPPAASTPSAAASGPAADAEFRLDDLGFGGPGTAPATRSTAVRSSGRRAAPPERGPSRPLVAIGVLLLLASVFAASYFLSGRVGTDLPEVEPPSAENVVATDQPPGVLLLDAAPWAAIEKITDSAGEEVTVVGARFTPKRLELAPGVYTVALKHPPSGESKQATLQVASGGEQKISVSFDFNVEEFFRRAGW